MKRLFFIIVFLNFLVPLPTQAFTQCLSYADCGGRPCLGAAEVYCARARTQLEAQCLGAPVEPGPGSCENIVAPDVRVNICFIRDRRCLFNDSTFSASYCPTIRRRVEASPQRDLKLCQEDGAAPTCRTDAECGNDRRCDPATHQCTAVPHADEPAVRPVKPDLQIPIPGVTFSNITYKTGPGGERYLDVPFIAQYVRGVYRFIAGAVGIVAVVMLIWGGVQWMLSRGESIMKAKETIRNALMGLVLVLGSYVLLFTINPELVSFKSLPVTVIAPQILEPHESPLTAGELSISGIRPQWLCHSKEECMPFCNQLDAGVVPPEATRDECPTLPPIIGNEAEEADFDVRHEANRNAPHPVLRDDANGIIISSLVFSARLKPEVADKLREVGRDAVSKGYRIQLNSACRSVKDQLIAICRALKNPTPENEPGVKVGWPGGSFHGNGQAVDVALVDKNTGRDIGAAGHRRLSELFYAHGWVRYCKESWHFEYGTNGQWCRSNDINQCGIEEKCP